MDPDRCPGLAWPHQLTVNTLISPETSGSRQSDTAPAINNRIHYTQQLFFNQPENEDYADSCISTGCPRKNALLTLEANISGLKAPIGKSWTSFENYMFSAFVRLQEQVSSIPASLRKSVFKKIT